MSITRCPRAAAPVPGRRLAAGTTVARARATVLPSRYPPGGRPSPGAAPCWLGGHRHVSTRGFRTGVKPAPVPGRAGLTCRAEWRVDASGPGRKASPSRRPASGLAAVSRPGWAAPSVTVRDVALGPPGLPLQQDRAARRPSPRRMPSTHHGWQPGPAEPDGIRDDAPEAR
jgi:hypothetical protein